MSPYETIAAAADAAALCAANLHQDFSSDTVARLDVNHAAKLAIAIDRLAQSLGVLADAADRVDRQARSRAAELLSAAGRQGWHGAEGALVLRMDMHVQPKTSDLITPGAVGADPAYEQSRTAALFSATQRLVSRMRSAGLNMYIDEVPNLEAMVSDLTEEGQSINDLDKRIGPEAIEVTSQQTVEVIR